jgi:aryl-alcohol dehydrogenase-like predicted oxidoreductase
MTLNAKEHGVTPLADAPFMTYRVGGTQKGQIVKDLIKTAWDNGINFFDNAEGYAGGQSEIEMGQAFKDLNLKREEIVVTTSMCPFLPHHCSRYVTGS